jgi:integrase/recombinase XerD
MTLPLSQDQATLRSSSSGVHQLETGVSQDARWNDVEAFLSELQARTTRDAYAFQIKKFLRWTGATWQEVDHEMIVSYKLFLQETLTASSINVALAALKSILTWLHSSGKIECNTSSKIQLLRRETDTPCLGLEEIKSIYEAIAHLAKPEIRSRDLALYAALLQGKSAVEIAALNIEDYDESRFAPTLARRDAAVEVPLAHQLKGHMSEYVALRKSDPLSKPESPIFISYSNSQKGNRLSYRGIHKIVKGWGKEAGVEELHPQRFRYSGSLMLNEEEIDGTSLHVVYNATLRSVSC